MALVIGSGQGMGLGAARALCRQSASVVLNDYCPERAESAAAALKAEGFHACAAPGDITLPEVREQLVATARSNFGEIDILVNNAGVPPGMLAKIGSTFEEPPFSMPQKFLLQQTLGHNDETSHVL